jgi:glycosyltransferase involved in cell wall biosynthesis
MSLKTAVGRLLPPTMRENLALREAIRKITKAPGGWRLKRFEDAEVARLGARFASLPRARVATITSTYRRPELLNRAIKSALAQTITDHIVIVVDDGGGLPDLPQDPRVFGFSLSRNTATIGIVRNVGLRLSNSEYVAFLDDDNEWDEKHLDIAVAALEDGAPGHRPDLIYTAVARVLVDGQVSDVISTNFDRKLLARSSYVDTNAIVIRRFAGLHFSRLPRKRWEPPEDWELVYRLSRRRRVKHVPVTTGHYLYYPDSYSKDSVKPI